MSDQAVVQREFFDQNWPDQPELVGRCKAFLHTGRNAVHDAERCEEIIGAVLRGCSRRAVARMFCVGRETITAIERLLEESGRMRPLKEREAQNFLDLATGCRDRLMEKLEADEVPVTALGVAMGIATDKWLALTGSPTAIVAHQKAPAEVDVTAEWDRLKRLAGSVQVPTDSESGGSKREDVDNQVVPVAVITAGDDAEPSSDRATGAAGEGGGGSTSAGRLGEPSHSAQADTQHKASDEGGV